MALKSFRDRNKIVVGLVSATALVLLLVSVFLVGTKGLLRDRYTVTGVFADTGGLSSGDDVRVAGVRVGEVTGVRPDFRRGQVLVTWKVDSGVDLGPSTSAQIEVANILGGRYLRLSGAVTTPHLADLPPAKRRIPLDRTQVPTTVNDVLNTSTRTVARLDTRSINTIVSELQGVDAEHRGRLSRTLVNLSKLAETVDGSSPQIKRMLAGGDRILALAHAKDQQLDRLLGNIQAMLDELQRRKAELAAFLGGGSRTVATLTKLIDDHQAQLVAVMSDLRGTLGTLRPQTGAFNDLLAWAGPTLSGLAGTGGYGPWLEVVATGLGPLSPQDLAQLARLAPQGER
ncbi:MCE family protein [Actinomadura montaniterrae]|uniref:MCE family protein n=1 Tax=Actinomadura montaniterrae TaxID=1803903 RepID=A0A6L3W4V5_9ACTN|nr:MlaD family protein [Actinomadura montaniterrae]KAB2388010.1 MCE family protein [Actinomadura montaniterrae]